MSRRLLPLLSAAAALPASAVFADQAPIPFAEAVFTEVVNDVQVVHRADASAEKAVKDAKFSAPDFVKTGRKSRAQLTAPDGTVARIGSNAVFSFDKDSRTINLEKGSVLFHSPTGKGGGTIVTNSATASVVGTTIMVIATPDGGFKMLVLEGIAKVTFPNGQVSTVNAGQMTLVRPGATIEKQDNGSSNSGSSQQTPTDSSGKPKDGSGIPGGPKNNDGQNHHGQHHEGRPGPVLNFDLGAISEGGLLSGFKTELPSQGKMRLARLDQMGRVREGELQKTGLVIIGGGNDENEFQIIPQDQLSTIISQIVQNPQQRLLDVASKPLDLDGTLPVPDAFIFRTAVQLPAELVPSGSTNPASLYLQGVAAGNLRFTGQVFDLGFMSGTAHTDVIGFRTLELGNVAFQTAPGTTSLRIGGGQLLFAAGSTISARLDGSVTPGQATRFEIVAFSSPTLDHITFENATGDVGVTSLSGDLRLLGGAVNAAPGLGHADLSADNGVLRMEGATVNGGLAANLFGRTGLQITGGSVTASHVDITAEQGPASVTGATVNGTGPNSIVIAGNGVQLTDTTLNSPGRVDINARTGVASITHTQINGNGLAITGDALNLVGGSATPVRDAQGNITPNAAFDAGTGHASLLAAKDLTVSGFQLIRGATLGAKANRLDVSDAKLEATVGNLTASVFEARVSHAEIRAAGDLSLDANTRDTAGAIIAPGKLESFNGAAFRSTAGAVLLNAGQARIHDTNLQANAGRVAVHTAGELTLDTNTNASALQVDLASANGAISFDSIHIQATGTPTPPVPTISISGNGVTVINSDLNAPGQIAINGRTGVASITRTQINANGLAITGDALNLVGGSAAPALDQGGNIIPNATFDAGTGHASLLAAKDLTISGFQLIRGATLGAKANRLDVSDAKLEATVGNLTASVFEARVSQAEIRAAGDLSLDANTRDTAGAITAPGNLESFNGAAFRSTAGAVLLNAGQARLHSTNLQAVSGRVAVHTSGELTLDTNSSMSALQVDLTSDSAAVTLAGSHIQANGTPPALLNTLAASDTTTNTTTQITGGAVTDTSATSGSGTILLSGGSGPTGNITAIIPPSGINIAGNGITLDTGTALDAGNGAIRLDARTFDLSLTKPDLRGSGVSLIANGARLTVTGQGGSEDAQGNITFGGWVYAGSKQLQISARDLTVDGYVEMSGDTGAVNLTGDANLHLTRIAATGANGVLDFHANRLTLAQAELVGGSDLNVFVNQATLNHGDLRSSGRITLQSTGDILLDTAQISAILDSAFRTDRNFTWTYGNITANGLKVTGLTGLGADTISITGINTSIPAAFDGSASIVLVANTLVLDNVAFSSSASVLLRSKTGRGNGNNPNNNTSYSIQGDKVNVNSVTLGGQDIVTSTANLVWIPKQNIGDVTAPIHVLDLVTQDFRGTKLDYSRITDLTETSFSRITDTNSVVASIPNSNTFRQGAPAMLNYGDFGLLATDVLPDIVQPNESVHSPLEVKGILARSINLTGPFTLDINPLNPAGTEVNDRLDIVATNAFTWSGDFTVTGDAGSHRRLEIRARNLLAQAGATFTKNLPFDGTATADSSTAFFGTIDAFVSNGNPTSQNSFTNTTGSLEIGSARGDVVIYHTNIQAGDHLVDLSNPQAPTETFQPGVVRVSTLSAGHKIQVTGGTFRGRALATFDTGVDLSSETVDINGTHLKSQAKTLQAASMNVSGPGNTPGLTGVDTLNAGDDIGSGIIAIHGTKLAKISGNALLVAQDISVTVNDPNSTNTSDATTDAIDVNGASFAMPGSVYTGDARYSTGIAMSAKTVNIANVVFPDNVQIRLKSQDGNLNIGSKMFGAVNFVNNVGIRSNGSIGTVTPLTTEAGINSKVWIENHVPGTTNKVFFNGAPASITTTGTLQSGLAPIHIQQIGAANVQGQHGRQAL